MESLKNLTQDDLKNFLISKSKSAVEYVKEKPLWVKLSLATTVASYGFVKYKWSALNGCGFDVLEPSLMTFGTSGKR